MSQKPQESQNSPESPAPQQSSSDLNISNQAESSKEETIEEILEFMRNAERNYKPTLSDDEAQSEYIRQYEMEGLEDEDDEEEDDDFDWAKFDQEGREKYKANMARWAKEAEEAQSSEQKKP